jgi:hypothetical protein
MNNLNGKSRGVLQDISRNQQCSVISLSNETSFNRSDSRLSQQDQNRGFLLKDICPDQSTDKKLKHRRVSSQNIDILSPQYLFSLKKPEKLLKSQRSSLRNSDLLQVKKFGSLLENDELNSTRSHTSQSKRMNDESIKSVSQVLKLKNSELEYCKNCKKHVEISRNFPENSDVESKIVEFLSYFIVCWEPEWAQPYKVAVCEICRNII